MNRSPAIVALSLAAVAVTVGGVVAASGGSSRAAAPASVRSGGILRIGTINGYDSMNPFVAYSAQSYDAFIMQYPILVQYKDVGTNGQHKLAFEGDWASSWTVSKDGKTYTFKLRKGKWSDGRPLTASDAVWTGNLILKYKNGPAASLAPFISHVKSFSAPDPQTLVIRYDKAVGNALPQLQQFYILPPQVWKSQIGPNGKGLKAYAPEDHLPSVSAGPFTLNTYDKKGTSIFKRNPSFYGPPANVDAVGLEYFTNEDALLQAFKSGSLDMIDDVPPTAVKDLQSDPRFNLSFTPGAQINDFIFNSNPKKPKNRELLNPKVRLAFEHAIDRQQIANTVFLGHAKPWASIISPLSGDWVNPNVKPAAYNIKLANQILDGLGYKRGSDGIRRANGHEMSYDVITPADLTGINREFDIVQEGLRQVGVKLNQRALDGSTAFSEITAPNNKYLNYDLSMWDWVGYQDPDFMLSVLTCAQYGGWSDSGYCNKTYDALYAQQGATVNPVKRRQIVWRMQQMIANQRPYIMLVDLQVVQAYGKKWAGFVPFLDGYSKVLWTDPHQVS
jgi:peptide/nickel transport system substrate-binding protein